MSDTEDQLRFKLSVAPRLNHAIDRLTGDITVGGSEPTPMPNLTRRIVAAYQKAAATPLGSTDSVWLQLFAEQNAGVHSILMGGDETAQVALLADPVSSTLGVGFDHNSQDSQLFGTDYWRSHIRWMIYDSLLTLAEAAGIQRLDNSEAIPNVVGPPADDLLPKLDDIFGFKITFPNPYPRDFGIPTSRGIISYRAIQALYQSWRLKHILGDRLDARILEIGAGSGRNAYYSRQFGFKNYTIVDLPLTNVAQANYLGRTVGQNSVCLFGEQPHAESISIVPPVAFLESTERYDLVLNVDSMTEFSRDTAATYWQKIRACAAVFFSINHEANSFTVRDLYLETQNKATRWPYWLRRGYTEELVMLS